MYTQLCVAQIEHDANTEYNSEIAASYKVPASMEGNRFWGSFMSIIKVVMLNICRLVLLMGIFEYIYWVNSII